MNTFLALAYSIDEGWSDDEVTRVYTDAERERLVAQTHAHRHVTVAMPFALVRRSSRTMPAVTPPVVST